MEADVAAYGLGMMCLAVALTLSVTQLIKLSVEWVIRRRQERMEQAPFGRRRG